MNLMKKIILLLYITLSGQAYSQQFPLPSYMTTMGLEMDRLDNFSVVVNVNESNNELRNLGLNQEQILRKIKLALESNNTPANGTDRYPYLSITITGMPVKSKNAIIGYNIIFQTNFMRFINFEANEQFYEHISSTWNVQNFGVFSSEDLKDSSMKIIIEMIDFFSNKLVEANK